MSIDLFYDYCFNTIGNDSKYSLKLNNNPLLNNVTKLSLYCQNFDFKIRSDLEKFYISAAS